jgi:CRP/FNR family transcriptional regulator, cyclic AMP receptor protein
MPFRIVPGRDRKLNRLMKRGVARNLRKGQALYSMGDPAGQVFVVASGFLRLTAHHGAGPERTVDLAGPMELAGEEGLVPGARRRTGARAGSAARVILLDGESVDQALRTASRTFHVFLQAREDALSLARITGTPPSAGGTPARLAAVLFHLSGRFGRKEGSAVRITVRITHQVLADLSGSHRSTVTTLLNDWIYEGVLGGDGRELQILRPLDLAALSRGAEP